MKKKKLLIALAVGAAAIGGAFVLKLKKEVAKSGKADVDDDEVEEDFALQDPPFYFRDRFVDKQEYPELYNLQMHLFEKAPITMMITWQNPEALKELLKYKEECVDGYDLYVYDIINLFEDIVDEENITSLIALCYQIERKSLEDRI